MNVDILNSRIFIDFKSCTWSVGFREIFGDVSKAMQSFLSESEPRRVHVDIDQSEHGVNLTTTDILFFWGGNTKWYFFKINFLMILFNDLFLFCLVVVFLYSIIG